MQWVEHRRWNGQKGDPMTDTLNGCSQHKHKDNDMVKEDKYVEKELGKVLPSKIPNSGLDGIDAQFTE